MSTKARRIVRFLGKTLLALLALAGLLIAIAVAVLSTDWAKQRARVLLEEQITRLSGGSAEIASLDYDLTRLRVELGGFVLHGTEGPESPALFRAARITVDATVLSWMGKQFRVDALEIDRPAFHLIIDEEGRNNLPKPPGTSTGKPFTHTIIDLGARHLEIRNGIATFAETRVPLDLRGDNLNLTLDFERALERYAGSVSVQRLQFSTDSIQPVPFDFRTNVILERDRLSLNEGRLAYAESEIRFSTTLDDFQHPRIAVPFEGAIRVQDFHREFRLPVEPRGRVSTRGEFRLADAVWSLTGTVDGQGLGFRSGAVRVDDISLRSSLALEKDLFVFPDLTVQALGGEVRGMATLRDSRYLEATGEVTDLSLDRVSRATGTGPLAFASRVSGTLSLQTQLGSRGATATRAEARLELVSTGTENPLSGTVNVRFTQDDQSLSFTDTHLQMANSQLSVGGSIRDALTVDVSTRRMEDFLPALALLSESPETLIPIRLGSGGSASFRGTLRGTWNAPRIAGTASGTAIGYEGRFVDSISATVDAEESQLQAREVLIRKADIELRGSVELPLREWKPVTNGPLRASVGLRAGGLRTILAEVGQADLPLKGRTTLDLQVRGSIDAPEAAVSGSLRQGEAYGETFDELQVRATYEASALRLSSATVRRGSATATLSGLYSHPPGLYESGNGQFAIQVRNLALGDLALVRKQKTPAEALLSTEATGRFQIREGKLELDALDGGLELSRILYEGKPAGSLSLGITSANGVAQIKLQGDLASSTIQGNATVGLHGDHQTKASLQLSELTLDSVRPWLLGAMDERSFPVKGSVAGDVRLEGPLAKPDALRGEMVIRTLRLATLASPVQTLERRTPVELHNTRPMRFEWDGRSLSARDVELDGTGTRLSVSGKITPSNVRQQLDLQARGSLNFNIISAIEPTLEADGRSDLDLTVRGTFQTPDVYGLLDLKDASLFLTGVPNGLDKINGRVFLYRDRANIEEIRAESGGGSLTLNGFVSYNQGVPAFRLSARGNDVRVRYPPGVSTSANAALELTGSRNQSILSGNVTITRVALNPRSDLGSILTSTSKPVATPSASQNDFLRNMRFDVRVQTASDVRFDSTLTQDLAGEADLRLRGNPYTPVLLGNVTISQGEVNFFGNRYFIDRGEISFLNPLKMEPVLNLDLRTRVRSIDVTLTFSGPIEKLNINYRSDPPLQLNEIIALLTVGRAPAGSPSLAQAQNEAAQSWQQIGASALVGQAVAAPIAGRLQKFFGVSRIKIDPRLTGVENNPQARLTVEQQVNRDLTVTFITNLADAQQQIVRVEWNLTSEWSMVALRDEDGLFGIDFLFRKRF
jgi:translocation and assembly module TamB